MTHRLLARLLAALGVLVLGLVLPASPAAASCAGIDAVVEGGPAVAFIGTDQRRVSDGDRLIVRFRVERALRGEVQRTQDVVVPNDQPSSGGVTSTGGVSWSPGDRVLVLGDVGESGVVSTNQCMAVAEGGRGYDRALRELGEGTEPLPGVDRVEPEALSHRDFLWVRLVVGLVGLTGLGVLATRWWRGRRA